MSHFSVLVIGDNVEQQLAPYHEFECTGLNDRYVQDVDETEEVRTEYETEADEHASFLDWCDENDKHVVREGESPDLEGGHKYGYVIVNTAGELVKAVNRTNPNRKWDWWVTGGRWSGWLRLKPGCSGELGRPGLMGSCANEGPGFADIVRKGDVDFEWMQREAADKAAAEWDKAHRATGNATWESRERCLEVHHKDNIDAACSMYHGQPAIVALKKAFKRDAFFMDFDQFQFDRDKFVHLAAARAICPFALVKDGQWHEKGRMGWWACVSEEMPEGDWIAKATEALLTLPDNTLLTVVDCHI